MTAVGDERAAIRSYLEPRGVPDGLIKACPSLAVARERYPDQLPEMRDTEPADVEFHDEPPSVDMSEPSATTPPAAPSDCTTVCLADVVARRIEWLWEGRIQRGAITLIDGEPGKGKGCITCDLASRVTRGQPMPFESTTRPPADVLIMTAEDDLQRVIRPRLDVAGADVARVHAITAMPCANNPDAAPTLAPADVSKLEAAIVRHGAKLVIIDPLMAFLPSTIDAHRDQDVRRVLTPLARIAERTGAAIVVVRHPRKGAGTAMHRGGGSIGIGAAARSVLFVGDDPEDAEARVLVGAKENNSRRAPGLRFRIVGATHPTAGEVPRVEWLGMAVDITADQLADTTPKTNAVDAAVAALRDVLADGPVPADHAIEQVTATVGCSAPTVQRAKKQAGVIAEQVRGAGGKVGRWMWRLPEGQARAVDHLVEATSASDATSQRFHGDRPDDHDEAITSSGEPLDNVVTDADEGAS